MSEAWDYLERDYRPAPALPPQPQARQVEPPHGRGLRSAPPPPIPGAPFERDPNDRD